MVVVILNGGHVVLLACVVLLLTVLLFLLFLLLLLLLFLFLFLYRACTVGAADDGQQQKFTLSGSGINSYRGPGTGKRLYQPGPQYKGIPSHNTQVCNLMLCKTIDDFRPWNGVSKGEGRSAKRGVNQSKNLCPRHGWNDYTWEKISYNYFHKLLSYNCYDNHIWK